MKKYTVGFIISEDKDKILLIEKNRPEYLKGLYNGIGGKLELNENPLQCMIRECKEETNLDIEDWNLIGVKNEQDFTITFFYTLIPFDTLNKFKQLEDEKLEIFDLKELPEKTVPNLIELINYIQKNLI